MIRLAIALAAAAYAGAAWAARQIDTVRGMNG